MAGPQPPPVRTLGPLGCLAWFFAAGASCGMTITAGMPSSVAASEIACAWLPDEKATTPARRWLASKRASAL